jgi:hypothetical protein
MPVQRIPNTARRTESSPLPVPTTVDLPSPSFGPVNLLVGTDPARDDSRTVHTRRAGGTETARSVAYLPVPSPTAPVHLMPAPAVVAVKPPRLSFGGFCLYCDQRGCQSPDCIALHADSAWTVCPACYGRGWTPNGRRCGCVWGVTQTDATDAGAVTQ